MNAFSTGSIVVVSPRLPSKAWTISGKPVAPVSSPMVICGSSRRSLENPGLRNSSAVSVSKYSVDTSYITKEAGPSAACFAQAAARAAANSAVAYQGSGDGDGVGRGDRRFAGRSAVAPSWILSAVAG